jgi:uncharacterized protein (DUF736 family)
MGFSRVSARTIQIPYKDKRLGNIRKQINKSNDVRVYRRGNEIGGGWGTESK